MRKGEISLLLRKLRVIYFTDWLRFYFQKIKNGKVNRDFKLSNPEVQLPPDYLIYESFQLNYHKYYTESQKTAQWLINHLSNHIVLEDKNILDWGCGPGRIIRHFPNLLGNSCRYFGTDYNKESIRWCSKNIEGVTFNHNSLVAQLPYEDNFFDVIYGISIYTHLSEKMHFEWHRELRRILKVGGIMFLTTQGDPFKVKLTNQELIQYNAGRLVVRGDTKEGHRTFSAFHPTIFMKKMFQNFKIEAHIVAQPEKGKWLPQDIWIIRKLDI